MVPSSGGTDGCTMRELAAGCEVVGAASWSKGIMKQQRRLLDRNGHAAVSIKPKQAKTLYTGLIRFDSVPGRICNASMGEPVVLKPNPMRPGSEDHKKWPSLGGC